MVKLYLILFALFITLANFSQKNFSKLEVFNDLEYLRKSLEEAHYDPYTYVTKKTFDTNYVKISSLIKKDSLTLLETTSLFQRVISKINNGHTEIHFPAQAYIKYAKSGGTLFPLELAFENGRVLIRKNWSKNSNIVIRAELLNINGTDIEPILHNIFPLVSAERRYFKLAKIELISFPRLYWQAYGEQNTFSIEISNDNYIEEYSVEAINPIDGYETKRREIFTGERRLKFLNGSAYLKPGNFSGDQKKFEKFIDSSFVGIVRGNYTNLIIDLRNNLGGDNSFSDYLVSYIADKPFQWNSEFKLKTSALLKAHVRKNYDISDPFWNSVLMHPDGRTYPYKFDNHNPQPKGKRFKGKVYVLVNRQTHSQAAVTTAQIQDYNFGTVVGEETGDSPSLLASQYSFVLPNTKIEVKIAKGLIVRVNGNKKAEGVIPDITIKDHLLDEDDEILTGLMSIIDKQN